MTTTSTNKMFKIIGIDAVSTGDVLIFKDEEDLKTNGHKMFSKERLWESVLKAADKNSRIMNIVDRSTSRIALEIKAIVQE